MSYMKGVRSGAEGNRKLLGDYGGKSGSGPAARQHYATGGAVKGYAFGGAPKGGNPSLSEGLSAAGSPAKPSLARAGRKMPGSKKNAKGGKTNVNVIIAQAPDKGAMPPALGAGPGPGGPPPGPPPMPPPGAGGPPMPMRAAGGRINNLGKYAHGGGVKREEGGRISEDSKTEAAKLRNKASQDRGLRNVSGGAAGLLGVLGSVGNNLQRKGNLPMAIANGVLSAGSHLSSKSSDAEADRIEKGLVKPGEEDRKSGGRACKDGGGAVGLREGGKMVGSGGGLGRLAKMKKYGK